jgi:hypothetical protein
MVAGGLWGNYIEIHERDGTVSGYNFCREYKPDDWPPCSQIFDKEYAEATKYQGWDAAIVALVPIPIGWLLMWGLVVFVQFILRVLNI